MFNIIDPKITMNQNNISGDGSPGRSEVASSYSHNKQGLSKKGTDIEKIDHIEQTLLQKNRSNFSRQFQKGNINSIPMPHSSDVIHKYGNVKFETTSNRSRSSIKKTNMIMQSPHKDPKNVNFEEAGSNTFSDEESVQKSAINYTSSDRIGDTQENLQNAHTAFKDVDNCSENELENYLFGEQANENDQMVPRIYEMDQAEIAKYIFSFIKIKSKKQQYEVQLFKQEVENNFKEIASNIEQATKEGREYNMILHSELEEFVNNKKKEFYQKFIEIKKTQEEQESIKESFSDNFLSMRQI